MRRIDTRSLLPLALLSPMLLAACADPKPPRELAAETRKVVQKLRVDSERIVAADERVERLTASLIGARRQTAEQTKHERHLFYRAGQSAKTDVELAMKEIRRIVGEDTTTFSLFDNSRYRPNAILAGFPTAEPPRAALAKLDSKLGELEKPLNLSEVMKIYTGIAKEIGEAAKKAAEKSEQAADSIEIN